MTSRWWWRAGLSIVGFLACLYLLTPSFFRFQNKIEESRIKGVDLPFYYRFFPEKEVKLGLDLQGGIHLVLGVGVDKALRDQVSILSKDLLDDLKSKNHPVKTVEPLKDEPGVQIEFGELNDELLNEIRLDLRKRYSQMEVRPDAKGSGLRLIYRKEEIRFLRRNAVDQALQVLRNRIDEFGVNEPSISAQGSDRILVQLPGVKDPARAKELIGRTAQLTFKMVDDTTPILDPYVKDSTKIPQGIVVDFERLESKDGSGFERPFLRGEDRQQLLEFLEGKIPDTHSVHLQEIVNRQTLVKSYRTFITENEVLITGDMLEDARPQVDPQWNRPEVGIKFNVRGTEIFRKVTTERVRERFAIILDGNISSAPRISEPIPGGRARITLGSSLDSSDMSRDARDLAIVLRAGSLKAPVEILEDRTIGPTLGLDSIRRGRIALLMGVFLVILFMFIYYKKAGLIADVALIFNGLLIISCLVLFQATLTLPGIAGLILTIGMAVDANVIIFERIREELRAGKNPESAVDSGYERAWWTVFDANITTALAGLVLMQYGTGPIKGFAVTLLIGIFFSFITAIYVTRIMFEWVLAKKDLEKLSI